MQHSTTCLNGFAGESMHKINKAILMTNKDIPGTSVFILLMIGIILLIGGQDTRYQLSMVIKTNAETAVAVDAEDTRVVNATQKAETMVQ